MMSIKRSAVVTAAALAVAFGSSLAAAHAATYSENFSTTNGTSTINVGDTVDFYSTEEISGLDDGDSLDLWKYPSLSPIFSADVIPYGGEQPYTFDTPGEYTYFSDIGNYEDYSNIIDVVATTPIPAAFPLFASGLGVVGLLARRRKRKAAAALAA
jgi:plastocyanin